MHQSNERTTSNLIDQERTCPVCGDLILGRIDKKFCNDQCRSDYNNIRNRTANNLIRRVNGVLRKNRRILMELNPNGKIKLPRQRLAAKGFDFQYFTSIYRTKTGNTYYFCYDQGYLLLDDKYCALVRRD